MSSQQKTDPVGAVIAAEIALHEDEVDVAENALLEALSHVRRQKYGGD